MRVVGIDFTSRPSGRKPVVAADAALDDDVLTVTDLHRWSDPLFSEMRSFLHEPGPWIAGLDLPFGMPSPFVTALGWPTGWEGYAAAAGTVQRERFGQLVTEFRASRPPGEPKHPRRETDVIARAQSPVNVIRPPVGLMWHAAAPLLLDAPVDLVPCRRLARGERYAVETYPALVAERLLGHRRYKGTGRGGAFERRSARERLVSALAEETVAAYGIRLRVPDALRTELVADHDGDRVDAVACALQAAWSWQRRDVGFGVPPEADADEGWIVDPTTADHLTR